jgi:hypothetical protein
MSKQARRQRETFATLPNYSCVKFEINLKSLFYEIIFFFVLNCAFPLFVFLLIFTLGLRELNFKLKLREIISNAFKKILMVKCNAPTDDLIFSRNNFFQCFNVKRVFVFQNSRGKRFRRIFAVYFD